MFYFSFRLSLILPPPASVFTLFFPGWGEGYTCQQVFVLFLIAGHVWGDPCEFGFLSVLNTVWSRHPADKYGPHHAQDARLGQGIGTSFVWLAAQAHNQGQCYC